MKFTYPLLLVLAVAAPAPAAITFDITPSASTANVNGLEFSPAGGSLVVTNTMATADMPGSSSLYLDFGVGYDHADAAGNVVFRPRNDVFQLYLLTGTLLQPPGSVVAEGVFVGSPEAFHVGGGRYEFHGDLLGAVGPAYSALVNPGSIDLMFDMTLPLGHQVIGGAVRFQTVPEPGGAVLFGVGVAIVGVMEYQRRNIVKSRRIPK